MSENQPYQLYELSSEEFERLCIDLLVAADSLLIGEGEAAPRWIDAIAKRKTKNGDKFVAIEISHRTTFHPEGLRLFLERSAKEVRKFDEYIFITSSPIQEIHRQLVYSDAAKTLNAEVKILGQQELIELLNSHQDIAAKYFKSVRDRVRHRRISTFVSSIALIASLTGLVSNLLYDNIYSFFGSNRQTKSQFSTQIKSVEESLSRLSDLENGLRKLKGELQEKSIETARVTKEYEEAMKLKSLTTEQLDQVRKAVNAQSRIDVFLNYLFGFILGVAASVLATIITDKWKQRRALARPYV